MTRKIALFLVKPKTLSKQEYESDSREMKGTGRFQMSGRSHAQQKNVQKANVKLHAIMLGLCGKIEDCCD